eukprot:CAMPEP_0197702988 /NCGR_PEP_ID=MMETSP1338-20131121/125204_1 /TAXON_ID=43686 ORGANISM="Pelagodinium beii, Strain RCC1491" /NCGR_SAMPLE_ID=MMETSP1338 /ASSEMBLY_ACC=CAM_ASM_000754 /LENGTH=68 /DNA_ID=CAMNT_0043286881 /DNA_START=71 /DNA_END=274 /DNA_ORIENTATION=-
MTLASSGEGDLEKQLKAWRCDLEARKSMTAGLFAGRSLPEVVDPPALSVDPPNLSTPLRSLDFEGLGT